MNLNDAIGQTHARVQSRPRIVSLVPSLTELLCDLGLAHYLVGRTGFCIHPATVVGQIPKIGGTKDVNIEKVRRLAPTHLLVNIDENERPTVELLQQFIPHVIVTHPLAPRDNLALYQLLGGIFAVEAAAQALVQRFEAQYCAVQQMQQMHQRSEPQPPQTVLYCIWQGPWMTISSDTYIARMLELIGWQQWQFPDNPARYPAFDWDQVPLVSIDRILLSSEPYRFTAQHVSSLQQQLARPVQLVDGEYLSWYGSRAIAGLAYLQQLTQA
jgi:ABC-type Fe3+-hydroxamate transport system substrate-binding protein